MAGQLQDWEALDPPTGCSAEANALLACGQYSVSAHTPVLLDLVEGALQDAVSAGQPGGAGRTGSESVDKYVHVLSPNGDTILQSGVLSGQLIMNSESAARCLLQVP